MKAKSQEPENHEDYKNRPEHCCLPFKEGHPERPWSCRVSM
jgi:hypothetical protein